MNAKVGSNSTYDIRCNNNLKNGVISLKYFFDLLPTKEVLAYYIYLEPMFSNNNDY